MSEKKAEHLSLHGDPQRQAVLALYGYVYQIWHSVHAWLDLKDEELLFLEGAEDFDITSSERATAVQVKATSANITLNSPSVTDAIGHFWQLKQAHPGREIFFRFLTRSRIGLEQGHLFGREVAGLELWQRCPRDPDAAAKLRDFLLALKEGVLPNDLRIFLASTDTAQIVEQLIVKISWETESEEAGYVKEAIERKLVLHGERNGIPPAKSASVVSRLLEVAFTTACDKNQFRRFLDRALFLRTFEEGTTERVPYRQLQVLMNATTAAGSLLSTLSGGLTGLPLQAAPLIETTIPPIQTRLTPRDQLVATFKT